MNRHLNEPNRQPQIRVIAKRRERHWFSDHPQFFAFLLATVACYLFLLLLSLIPVTDYTAGGWTLFN